MQGRQTPIVKSHIGGEKTVIHHTENVAQTRVMLEKASVIWPGFYARKKEPRLLSLMYSALEKPNSQNKSALFTAQVDMQFYAI